MFFGRDRATVGILIGIEGVGVEAVAKFPVGKMFELFGLAVNRFCRHSCVFNEVVFPESV